MAKIVEDKTAPEMAAVEVTKAETAETNAAQETPETVQAEVTSDLKKRKVTGLRDHQCRIGFENVKIEKNKETLLSENAAYQLAKQGIVLMR